MAGRREQRLTDDGPVSEFANELRELRRSAGLTYDQLAKLACYSKSAVHEAARGRQLPSWPVTAAFVRACGGIEEEWRERWEAASACSMPPTSDRSHEAGTTRYFEAPTQPGDIVQPLSRQRHIALWLALGAVGLCLLGSGSAAVGAAPSETQDLTQSEWRTIVEQPPDQTRPGDGMDPIRTGCGSPEHVQQVVTLDDVPLLLPGDLTFGRLLLRNAPHCHATWGLVTGPHGPQRRVHITIRRPADHTQTTSSFAGESSESYGNMLSTAPGCEYVEAYVQTPEGNGPTARSRCA